MRKFLRNNSLSLVFLLLFLFSIIGQIITGFHEFNKEMEEEYGAAAVSLPVYLTSGHFLQATFENWESEFLQMALFVLLTVSLRQKGSSESKSFEEEEVDREPSPRRKDVPWPVKKGGIILTVYKSSLTIVLLLLFIASFCIHLYGSLRDENTRLFYEGKPPQQFGAYITEARFWFESFQNWQSEFLSVFAIVILSIYFRQKGSPQSKPVDAPHSETGE
jgi:hypothetical protein